MPRKTSGAGYVIRSTVRGPGGLVTYTVVDLFGQVRHVSVPYKFSYPAAVDPILERTAAGFDRPTKPL
jgi:hypothetical protein